MSHTTTVVIIDAGVAAGDPLRAISFLEPEHEWESGFAAWSVPPERTDDISSELVCLCCFTDEHPSALEGLALARKHGEAIFDAETWTVR